MDTQVVEGFSFWGHWPSLWGRRYLYHRNRLYLTRKGSSILGEWLRKMIDTSLN